LDLSTQVKTGERVYKKIADVLIANKARIQTGQDWTNSTATVSSTATTAITAITAITAMKSYY
jgi:hypothetical protein